MPSYLARWGSAREREARVRIELLVTQLERFFTRWAVQGTIEIPRDQARRSSPTSGTPALTRRRADDRRTPRADGGGYVPSVGAVGVVAQRAQEVDAPELGPVRS